MFDRFMVSSEEFRIIITSNLKGTRFSKREISLELTVQH